MKVKSMWIENTFNFSAGGCVAAIKKLGSKSQSLELT